MKLPAGGVRVFDFGSNTYSYVGSDPIDPYGNPDNWESVEKEVAYTKTEKNIKKYFFTLTSPKTVEIQNLNSQLANYAWALSFYRKVGNTYVMAGGVGPVTDPDPDYPQYRSLDFEAGEYYAQLSFVELNVNFTGTANFTATYRDKKISNINPYLLGGGVRINSISYYDRRDQYTANQAPAKKINFSYNDDAGSGKSSGALIFPKPVHHYEYNYSNDFVYVCSQIGKCKYHYTNTFTIFSSQNFIPVQKTQGADVGYQNVKVYETGKGESLYTYTSPIDNPNPDQVSSFPPFVPVANYDYKRGLLMDEQKKDNNTLLQYKKSNQYNIYDTEKLTGINLRHVGSPFTEYIYAGHFKTYDTYISGCSNGSSSVYCGTDDPASMIASTPNVEIVGKANQTHAENTEFYPNGGTIKTFEDITYNTRDYPIKQKTTTTDLPPVVNETSYSYAHEKGNQLMIDKNMIGIPLETTETQTANGISKIIDREETIYPTSLPTTPTGNFVLPLSAKSYDRLNNISYTDVTYDRYDDKGNIIQYTGDDGIPVAIIWGYNATEPIVKVEGMTYNQLVNAVSISTVVSASNDDASNPTKEGALLDALNSFRKQSVLTGKKITTYTHDPLIGVTSITSPIGIRETFVYDSAGRLRDGNIRGKNNAGTYVQKKAKENNYQFKQ